MNHPELARTALDEGLKFYPNLQALIHYEDRQGNLTSIFTQEFPQELKDRAINIFNYEQEPDNYNQSEIFIYETDVLGRFVIATKAEDFYYAKEASSVMFCAFNRRLHGKE